MQKARPAILIISSNMRIGGVERSLLGLLSELSTAECDVSLFLNSHDGDFMAMLPPGTRLLEEIPEYAALDKPISAIIFSSTSHIAIARLVAKLVTAAKKLFGVPGDLSPRAALYAQPFMRPIPGNYDLAIGFLRPHELLLHKVRARAKVGWVHTDYTSIETGVDVPFESKSWKKLDAIIAVSESVAAKFVQAMSVDPSKVRVIENILSASMVRAGAAAEDVNSEILPDVGVTKICSVGRFTYAKGFDLAIEACHLLKSWGRSVRWYLIGYGSGETALRELVAKHGLQESFIILGKKTNPYPYIDACDIYAQTSRYEGKSVSVREAQILGKTVVITNFATANSQLEDGVDGQIVPISPKGIADGIARLIDDADLARRLAACARARTYGNEEEARKVIELIQLAKGSAAAV